MLEIGPGTGNLTVQLLERGKKIIAMEIDPRMIAEVTKRVQRQGHAHKFGVIQGDAIKTQMPFFDICHQFDISGKYPEEVHENLASRTEGGQEAIDLCIHLRTDVALEKAEEYGMPPYPFRNSFHSCIA